MDSKQFDDLTKVLGGAPSRRGFVRVFGGGLAAIAAHFALDDSAAKRKKKKPKKGPRCGAKRCKDGQFCCDDTRRVCCQKKGGECCNPGPGSGSCCNRPNRCGLPIDDETALRECCPPERQWFTSVGLVRCCPAGTRALEGITSDDGACCPEEKYCGETCCADGQICAGGQCCSEGAACGSTCCLTEWCMGCVGGTCQDTCGHCQFCNGAGSCIDCGVGCCGG
jgi:hypothetical protein